MTAVIMEVENKPSQTDPVVDPASQQAIASRITEAVQQQQALDNPTPAPAPAPAVDNGGKAPDVSTPKDPSPAPVDSNKELLALLETATGRKYESIDSAKQHISNLNSLVGDQQVADARKKADLFDNFVGKWAQTSGETVENAKKFWAEQLLNSASPQTPSAQPKPQPVVDTKAPQEIEMLKQQVDRLSDSQQRNDLLTKYPFAGEVKDEVAIIAKQKGMSQLEAFEQSPFKQLLETKAKEASEKSPVVTPSNSLRFDQKKIQELGARVMSPKASEADRMALVKELGLAK